MGFALCALALTALTPEYGSRTLLDPKTYRSPSGRLALLIDPTHPEGNGPADYRLTENGTLRWKKRLPFTFQNAALSDDGRAAGYGHTREGDEGSFHVALVGPQGQVLNEERHKIQPSRFIHTSGDPKATGLILDQTGDQALVRIVSPDVNRPGETWWRYRLSTGQRLPSIVPSPPDTNARFILDARNVPGTSLALVHYWSFDNTSVGAQFALIDPNGKIAWNLKKPGDYEVPGSEAARDTLQNEIREKGAILQVRPRAFQLRFVREKQRVSFALTKEGDAWRVRETARTPYATPKTLTHPKPASIPTIALNPLKRLILPLRKEAANPIRDIADFQILSGGRLAVLRAGTQPAVVITDAKGHATRTISLPFKKGQDYPQPTFAHCTGDRFVVFQSQNNIARAWRVDAQKGKVSPLPQFKAAGVERAVGFPDGSFAVLAKDFKRYTIVDQFARYDANGRLLWRQIDDGYRGRREEFLSAEDLAIDSQGHIVVLDNIANRLVTFDRNGRFLRDAKPAPEMEYPTYLTPTSNGQFTVFDFGSEKPVLHLKSSGKYARPPGILLDSTGKVLRHIMGMKRDSEGRLWASNLKSIFRFDANGRADRVLGQAPLSTGLREVESLVIVPNGRVYAMETDTSQIHAFTPEGKTLFVARPLPSDFPDRPAMLRFNSEDVTPSGEFYISGGSGEGILRFSATGQRLGYVPRKEAEAPPLRQKPKPTWRWWGPQVQTERGDTVATLNRWPNRDWMPGGPTAVAPDGSLVTLDSPYMRHGKSLRRIAWFSPSGQPQGMAQYPPELINRISEAYDGRLTYATTATHLYALDRQARLVWKAPLPTSNPNHAYTVFATQKGFALYDGEKTITYYRPPQRDSAARSSSGSRAPRTPKP